MIVSIPRDFFPFALNLLFDVNFIIFYVHQFNGLINQHSVPYSFSFGQLPASNYSIPSTATKLLRKVHWLAIHPEQFKYNCLIHECGK